MLSYTYTTCLAFFPLGDSPASEFTPPMKMEQTECSETSAHKFICRWITQKKQYNIQNKAAVLNQKLPVLF